MTVLATIVFIIDLLYKLSCVVLSGVGIAIIVIWRIERREAREAMSRINNRTEKRREEEKNDGEGVFVEHSIRRSGD